MRGKIEEKEKEDRGEQRWRKTRGGDKEDKVLEEKVEEGVEEEGKQEEK